MRAIVDSGVYIERSNMRPSQQACLYNKCSKLGGQICWLMSVVQRGLGGRVSPILGGMGMLRCKCQGFHFQYFNNGTCYVVQYFCFVYHFEHSLKIGAPFFVFILLLFLLIFCFDVCFVNIVIVICVSCFQQAPVFYIVLYLRVMNENANYYCQLNGIFDYSFSCFIMKSFHK